MVSTNGGLSFYNLNDSIFYVLKVIFSDLRVISNILNVSLYSLCVIMNVISVIVTFIIQGFAFQCQSVLLVWSVRFIRIFKGYQSKLNGWI